MSLNSSFRVRHRTGHDARRGRSAPTSLGLNNCNQPLQSSRLAKRCQVIAQPLSVQPVGLQDPYDSFAFRNVGPASCSANCMCFATLLCAVRGRLRGSQAQNLSDNTTSPLHLHSRPHCMAAYSKQQQEFASPKGAML